MSGSICSDGTSRLVYLQSDHFVTRIPLSIHFRTYISFIISGYSYYVNILVTRLKSDMCLVFFIAQLILSLFNSYFRHCNSFSYGPPLCSMYICYVLCHKPLIPAAYGGRYRSTHAFTL